MRVWLLAIALVSLGLAGCGLKGELYLENPPASGEATTAEPVEREQPVFDIEDDAEVDAEDEADDALPAPEVIQP